MGRRIRDISIIIAVTFLLFLAFEVALRIAWSNRSPEKDKPFEPAFQYDETYIIDLKPNVNQTFQRVMLNGGEKIPWSTNSDGFRGAELRKAEKRVMVYGDSNVQARFCRLSDTFPVRLEDYLVKTYKMDIEVVNAGVVGFGPDQYFLKFKKEVDRYRPELVIFNFFADNDFGDPIRNRLFELDDEGHLKETRHAIAPDTRLTGRSARGLFGPLLIFEWARGMNSKMKLKKAELSGVKGYAGLIEQEDKIYELGLARLASNFDDHYDYDLALFPESELVKEKIKLAEEILKEAGRFAASRGIAFMVAIEPSCNDITTNCYINYTNFEKYEGYRPENLTSYAESILKRNKIAGINLYYPFKEEDPSRLFFSGYNNHWNEAGQDLAARSVADFIYQSGLLK